MTYLHSSDAAECAKAIVDRVGRHVKIAVPIGIGKPVLLLDALYRLAEADRSLHLSIFTGLTLTRPSSKSTLEKRFVEPLMDRVLGSYREPLYVPALRSQSLPANIEVHEFFLQAGVWLKNAPVQQSYSSLNYSHVAAHLRRIGANTFAQAVAPPRPPSRRLSLSANTDVTLDMRDFIDACRKDGRPIVIAAEVNERLPFMPGDAEVEQKDADIVLEPARPHRDLFAVPKQPVTLQDYAMAIHAATLVKDGGTLQIGIGTFSDALTHALVLRHTRNEVFQRILNDLGGTRHRDAQTSPFERGLYGCTEMLVDGYLALLDAGILKRVIEDENGIPSVLEAGFFIGNDRFYKRLAEMPAERLALIRMRGISHTNTLGGDRAAKTKARQSAVFVNTAMTLTALGAVSSDATAEGQVVSGVGGQLDLVLQAHQLEGARSIIAVRATRRSGFKTMSNIVWSYANCTVPRSLRDVFVTEYGIADVRGKSDRDTVAAVVSLADGAFQQRLVDEAKRAGKLENSFRLEPRGNSAKSLEGKLAPYRESGELPLFPLGTEMSAIERRLLGPLGRLAAASPFELLKIFGRGLRRPAGTDEHEALERLSLDGPGSLRTLALRALVLGALHDARRGA